MAIILFGNGSIEEIERFYKYSISLIHYHISNSINLDSLYSSDEPYEHKVDSIEQNEKELKIIYQKKDYSLFTLEQTKKLKGRKSLFKNMEIKNDFCLKLIEIVEREYSNGFFVLPIPDNILLDEQLNPHYIYKAVEGMPIMGFDFRNLFSYLKTLIQYVYSDMTFQNLSNASTIETDDSFLVELSNTTNFLELKKLLGYEETTFSEEEVSLSEDIIEKEISEVIATPEVKKEPFVESIIEEKKKVSVPGVSHEKKQIEKTKEPPKQQAITQIKMVKSISYLTVIFGTLFVVCFSLSLFLGIDKLTTPSRLNSIKTELNENLKNLEKLESTKKSLEKEQESLKEENKELSEKNAELLNELETNAVMIEKVVTQNDVLKKELEKKK